MRFEYYLSEMTLSNSIIKELMIARPSWKSIKKDMSLPIIPKGKYIGSMKAQNCETNAAKYCKVEGGDVFEGYLIWKDEDGWQTVNHTFNVVDGRVYELTALEDTWDKNTYYIGKKK